MSYQFSEDPEEQLPDWLKALRREQRGETEEEQTAPGEMEEKEESVVEEKGAAEEAEEEPAWLSEIRERHRTEELHEDVKEGHEATEPDKLEDTQPQPAVSAETEASELQEQLDELVEDIGEEKAFDEATQIDDSELERGEIPSWLEALKPAGLDLEEAASTQEESIDGEAAGPLAGLSGVLPVEPEITQVGRTKAQSGRLDISRSQRRHRQTLEEMLAGETVTSEKLSLDRGRPSALLYWLIGAALLAASLIPLMRDVQRRTLPSSAILPETSAAHRLIEELPDSAAVLVAFEVHPSLYGELEFVASPVIGHLMERRARISFLSTLPTGPALADQLMRENFDAGGSYLNLGYLSGGTAALRHFAAHPREVSLPPELWASPALEGIEDLSDFDLILLVGSDAEDLRAWIEQAGSYASQGFLAATSAQASPLLYAYLQSDPVILRGLVGGLHGAKFYDELRGDEGSALGYWEAYSYTLGAAILMILVIGVYGRMAPQRPKRISPVEKEDESGD